MAKLEKLLAISSEPLAAPPRPDAPLLAEFSLGSDLYHMLHLKNGFFAFESALHVFPLTSEPAGGMNLEAWNSPSLWRHEYKEAAEGLLFFAEDAVQDQFCLSAQGVERFEAETGKTSLLADSIEAWADLILREHAVQTGWPLLNEWQSQNGPLPPGKRLMPKTPFFLGGAYSVDNLWAGDAVEGMRLKADLARQTRDLPDGSKVRLVVGKRAG